MRLLSLLIVWAASSVCAQDVAIRWVRPTSGPVGATVRISGTHLDRARFVTVGGMRVPIETATERRLTIRMPSRGGELRLWGSSGPLADGPGLQVTGDSPRFVELDPAIPERGQPVVIRVENLDTPYSIDLAGRRVVRSSTVLPPSFTVPEDAEPGEIVVRGANGDVHARLELHPKFNVLQGGGTFHAHDVVELRGEGFSAPMTMRMRFFVRTGDQNEARETTSQVTVLSPTRLRIRLPELPEGTYDGSLTLVDRHGRVRPSRTRVVRTLAFDADSLHARRGSQCLLRVRGHGLPLGPVEVFEGDRELEIVEADRQTITVRLHRRDGRCRTPRRVRLVVDGRSHDIDEIH